MVIIAQNKPGELMYVSDHLQLK